MPRERFDFALRDVVLVRAVGDGAFQEAGVVRSDEALVRRLGEADPTDVRRDGIEEGLG